MPISTESEAWHTGEEAGRLTHAVLAFLREHSDSAYRLQEVADEVMDTDFAAGRETDRLRDRLTEAEYNDRLMAGELPNEGRAFIADMSSLSTLENALESLQDMDLVESRVVDAEPFDLPYDWETVTAFAYCGPE